MTTPSSTIWLVADDTFLKHTELHKIVLPSNVALYVQRTRVNPGDLAVVFYDVGGQSDLPKFSISCTARVSFTCLNAHRHIGAI
jgi:hypothetical protein